MRSFTSWHTSIDRGGLAGGNLYGDLAGKAFGSGWPGCGLDHDAVDDALGTGGFCHAGGNAFSLGNANGTGPFDNAVVDFVLERVGVEFGAGEFGFEFVRDGGVFGDTGPGGNQQGKDKEEAEHIRIVAGRRLDSPNTWRLR